MRFFTVVFLVLLSASSTLAELKPSQARKLITRAAGSELPSGSVRVKQVSNIDANTAEATAEIETAFRLQQNEQGQWSVQEIRVGPDRWESIPLIASAVGASPTSGCDGPDLFNNRNGASEPSVKRARCLLALILGVQLPSDAVRIKSVSPFGLPFSSNATSLVTANIQVSFRFSNLGKGGWHVSDIRTGNRSWVDLDALLARVNEQKRTGAMAELQTVAAALKKFRSDRGFYVAADEQRVLIDHLAPHYLPKVIRLDPWHRPYQYEGSRDHFTLRSDGPDGKQNTPDDIVFTSQ